MTQTDTIHATPIFDELVATEFPDVPRILAEPWSFDVWKLDFDTRWERQKRGYAELAAQKPAKKTAPKAGAKPRKTVQAVPNSDD